MLFTDAWPNTWPAEQSKQHAWTAVIAKPMKTFNKKIKKIRDLLITEIVTGRFLLYKVLQGFYKSKISSYMVKKALKVQKLIPWENKVDRNLFSQV